jgi:hypothetical protein
MGKHQKHSETGRGSSEPRGDTDPDYVIGAGQYDDLCVFWSRQLSRSDQTQIVSISEQLLRREFYLHSLEVSTFSDSTFDTMAKVTKFFTHALEARNGTFRMEEIDTEFKSDVAFAWILIGLLEKRIVEYRQIGSVWVQIFWALLFLAWIRPVVSWQVFSIFTICSLILLFSSIRSLISVRKWIYTNGLSFFDTQMIPTSIAPLLLFGPGVLISLNRESGWTFSWWPVAMAVPAIACAVLTNLVRQPSHIRTVYKLSIASILLFNVVLVLYVAFAISFWYGLCVGLIFNWNISSALVGMMVLGLVIVGAFLRDVVSACRKNKNVMMICLTALPLVFGYTYMRWVHVGVFVRVVSIIVICGCACVGIPAPSGILTTILSRITVLAIDLFQLVIVAIQTVTATCIIFSSSPKLGLEWVKYLGKTFTMQRPDVHAEET